MVMSARDALLRELARQPDDVAQKLLDYLHAMSDRSAPGAGAASDGHFATYWKQYYGALEGEQWEEPLELPPERRDEW